MLNGRYALLIISFSFLRSALLYVVRRIRSVDKVNSMCKLFLFFVCVFCLYGMICVFGILLSIPVCYYYDHILVLHKYGIVSVNRFIACINNNNNLYVIINGNKQFSKKLRTVHVHYLFYSIVLYCSNTI